jgi:hypothetical protein
MKLFGKSEPRRKSRVVSAKHEPTVEETAVTGLLNGDMAEDIRAHIAVLAFQFYEQRGREDGHDVEDWLQAERRILAGSL